MARYLKLDRMEIHGFKSFYARTRFEFPEGITAVVGPNGCGKSNIGDAISWVLGEQKASSLRSDRMEDVIFNGSQGKKPLGMAEVSLHFRNIGPRAPACGTIDSEAALIPGAVATIEGEAPGNGNGHGNGHGPAADAALRSGFDAMPEDVGAVVVPILPEVATDGAESPDSASADQAGAGAARFVLEDLPDEVVVTRRLYRSGESEYALNGQQCRLRDVQDLLARTEIGTRLYTTIEQGKIDQILLAKPKERRVIIEEAAGILGYKNKRRQTEQKLEATQANLLRIADIAGEVEKQIQSLRRQAAKARRYRKLMETVRDKRGVVAWRRLLQYDAEQGALGAAFDEATGSEAATAAELGRLEADLENLRRKLEGEEERARGQRDAVHALDREIDRLQGGLRAGEEQAGQIEERDAQAREEIASLAGRIAAHQERGLALTGDLAAEAARAEAHAAALDAIESEQRARSAAIAGAEAALEARRTALLSLFDRLGEMGRGRASLEERTRAAESAARRLEEESGEAARSCESSGSEVDALEREAGARRLAYEEEQRSHDRLIPEARESEERLADMEKRLEEQRGRATALQERLEALRELERQRAGLSDGVADMLKGAGGFSPRGIVGEQVDIALGLERAVAAVLGRLQEAVLVASPQEASRGVAHLRRSAAGRVSFVCERPGEAGVDGLPSGLSGRPGVRGALSEQIVGRDSTGVVAARLARAVLVDDLDLALAMHAEFPDLTFVTALGDLVEPGGVVTGGDGADLQHGVLARRAEQAGLVRQIEALEQDRGRAASESQALRFLVEERRALAERSIASLQERQRDLFQAELQLTGRQADLARLLGTLPLLKSESDRLRDERAGCQDELERVGRDCAVLEEERRTAEESIRQGAEELAAGRAELYQVERQAGERRAEAAASQQRLAAMARERESLAAGERELAQRSSERVAERAEWEARAQTLREEDVRLRAELNAGLEARAAAAAAEEATLAGLAYDRSVSHAREQAARDSREALQAAQAARQEVEVRRARLLSDVDHLAMLCRDELGLELDALRASPPAFDVSRPLEEEESEVAQAREALEGLGPVNLMAIEQCAELEERFGFLSVQRKDLEDAVASLRDTIRRINRDSRQRFMTAFDAIQAGFQVSFTHLFGGGWAELRLQDGDEDVLEAGIEIAAQPPGKRLQSLALLSGGEKALTAVALLFSLFRYRPSPFCVLDEVDAPLDEANVERFTGLLRQLTSDTQFILITHNRKSMEAANLLYGVTMEEPGVSKVLPLRFE